MMDCLHCKDGGRITDRHDDDNWWYLLCVIPAESGPWGYHEKCPHPWILRKRFRLARWVHNTGVKLSKSLTGGVGI